MLRCANPQCRDTMVSDQRIGHHRIQLYEIELVHTDQTEGVNATQHVFAAVTCSRKCAIVVLNAELRNEEAESATPPYHFPSHADQVARPV